MKSAIRVGFALAMFAFGSLGFVTGAHATNANHSGTICKNYNASQVTDIDYLVSGTRNLNASARSIICPIVRAPTSTNNAAVYIDFYHSGTQTTSCTLYSYNYNGTYMGSASFTQTGSGYFDKYLSLPAGQAPYWANLAVLCTIPGGATGLLVDIDVVQ